MRASRAPHSPARGAVLGAGRRGGRPLARADGRDDPRPPPLPEIQPEQGEVAAVWKQDTGSVARHARASLAACWRPMR
jgi:hypothetical protein